MHKKRQYFTIPDSEVNPESSIVFVFHTLHLTLDSFATCGVLSCILQYIQPVDVAGLLHYCSVLAKPSLRGVKKFLLLLFFAAAIGN